VKAVVQRRFGPPAEVLSLEEVGDPGVGPGDVLLRVDAAGVNAADWHLVTGMPYVARPALGGRRPKEPVPGLDVAGRVEAVGAGVDGVQPGDEVFGWCTRAFAEFVRVPADQVLSRPAGLSAVQAAAVPLAAMTALQGLRLGGQRAGQRVLITGASGGVGTFAVQVAKTHGAHVTGVCGTRNLDMVRAIGADEVLDYSRDAVPPEDARYDLIFHLAGRISLRALQRALSPGGVVVLSAGDGGPWVGPLLFLARAVVAARLRRAPFRVLTAKNSRADLAEIVDLIASGAVTPVLDRTYGLPEAPAAVQYLLDAHTSGKVVITPSPPDK
jgi:NADPH:quinone reductase-like Zn-dependent oxidoreductase